jgi:LacI family transcriptional regulator, galactose operon repressor
MGTEGEVRVVAEADGRPRRPTVIDVARAAGVSVKTVSRVINNVPTVNPQIAERVLAAVADLGFRRNDMARNLRSGDKAASIGLIIEDFANPFYSTITAAVQEVAAQHDALLITASSEEDPERERRFLLAMCDRRVDGLLVVPAGSDHAYLRPEVEMGVPAVFLDRPPVGLHVDAVLLDNAGGARSGIGALLDRGHHRIALLVDSLSIHTMRERLAGAEAALEAAGIPHDPELVRYDLHEPGATARAIAEMLAAPSPPTAFFCGNNRITVGAVQELWRHGSDAALVGFDDFELAHLMPRPLTVISYDTRQLGRIGAEMLFRRIDGQRPRPSTIILPTQLVERGVPTVAATRT